MRFGLLGWALRIAVFAVLGSLIALFQIDRASGNRPELAVIIPDGLGGEADLVKAKATLNTDPVLAEKPTRDLVAKRPIPAEHLSLLALYLVETDQPQLAGQALTEASKRGWRDRYTQVTVLGSALANGSPMAAAQRLEALIRNRDEWEIQASAAQQVLAVPEGRKAFAQRVAESPGLSSHLIELVQRYGSLAPDMALTFQDARGIGQPIPCDDVALLSKRLLALGEGSAGSSLWFGRCGEGSVSDYALDYLSDDSGPFDWQFQKGDGVATKQGSQEGAVTIANRSPVRKMVAYRYASLPPGRHRFRLEARPKRGSLNDRLAEMELSLKCGGRQSTDVIANQAEVKNEFEFEVPADCSMQVLSIISSRGRTTDLKLTKL